MPDPITEAVKAWAYLHPLLLSLCCLKIIEISYLGSTGAVCFGTAPSQIKTDCIYGETTLNPEVTSVMI